MENVGVKLVRQAGAKTNELAGDGCTTSIVLAQGLISEGMKVQFATMRLQCLIQFSESYSWPCYCFLLKFSYLYFSSFSKQNFTATFATVIVSLNCNFAFH